MRTFLLAMVMCMAVALLGAGTASAQTCSSTASTAATIVSQAAAASNGSTVCVAAGSYGAINVSASRTGMVKVEPVTGASVTFSDLNTSGSASWYDFSGFTVTSMVDIGSRSSSSTNHITVENSNLNGGASWWTGANNILISHNNVNYIESVGGSNNIIDGNKMDKAGANSDTLYITTGYSNITISNNEITGVDAGNGANNHADCFQSFASSSASGLTFTGNWEHNNFCQGFFIKDGPVTGVTFSDNLFETQFGSGDRSNVYDLTNLTMQKNTIWDGKGFTFESGNCTNCNVDHNVIDDLEQNTSTPFTSSNNMFGTNPTTWTKSATDVVNSSPPFTNVAAHDYRLTDGSGRGVDWKPSDKVFGPVTGGGGDTTAPDTSITTPPSSSTSTSASIPFTGTDNVAVDHFECRIDGATYATCTSPKAYSGLSIGSHTFDVRAVDAAGNVDPTPATATWSVQDGTAPDTSITTPPSDSTSTSASIPFTGTDNVAVDHYECKLDAGSYATCTSPKAYSALSVGSHTFSVRAYDAAGNVDATPATATWNVLAPGDTTPPNTSITTAPSNSNSTSASIPFTGTDDVGVDHFECRIDGGTYAVCTSPKAYSGLTDGSHTFDVRAYDAAGNVDPTPATATWTVDTAAPNTTIDSGPTDPTTDDTPTFAFSSSETGSTFECKMDAGSYASCTSPYTSSSLSTGSHTFSVRATDAVGNVDATPATQTFTVNTAVDHTPVAAFTASPNPSLAGNAVTFTATGSTCTDAPCTYAWADVPPTGGNFPLSGAGAPAGQWSCNSDCSVLTFTFMGTGTKYVTLTVTDADGDVATVEHDQVVNTNPVFVSDTMTGTANTALTSHTGEIGATWTAHPSNSGTEQLNAAGTASRNTSTTGTSYYTASGTPPDASYKVEADFLVRSSYLTDTPVVTTLLARSSTSTNTNYGCQWNRGTGHWEIVKNSSTLLASSTGWSLTAGSTYHVTFTVNGSALSCKVGATTVVSTTDATITTAGKVGFRNRQSPAGDTHGIQVDNVVATDI